MNGRLEREDPIAITRDKVSFNIVELVDPVLNVAFDCGDIVAAGGDCL